MLTSAPAALLGRLGAAPRILKLQIKVVKRGRYNENRESPVCESSQITYRLYINTYTHIYIYIYIYSFINKIIIIILYKIIYFSKAIYIVLLFSNIGHRPYSEAVCLFIK